MLSVELFLQESRIESAVTAITAAASIFFSFIKVMAALLYGMQYCLCPALNAGQFANIVILGMIKKLHASVYERFLDEFEFWKRECSGLHD